MSLGLFLLYSIPPFVAGMLFLFFFCYGDYLRWFPDARAPFGRGRATWAGRPIAGLSPASRPAGGLPVAVQPGRHGHVCPQQHARRDLQDYIRTARAKGLPEGKVIFKHAFRNALIPIITLFASFLPAMLGGSVLIEMLFSIPGMGRLSFESILLKDFPTRDGARSMSTPSW